MVIKCLLVLVLIIASNSAVAQNSKLSKKGKITLKGYVRHSYRAGPDGGLPLGGPPDYYIVDINSRWHLLFIKICESNIEREELRSLDSTGKIQSGQPVILCKFRIKINDGKWDDCRVENRQSRTGKYAEIIKLKRLE